MPTAPKTHDQLLRETHPHLFASRGVIDHERRRLDPIQREADRLRASRRWRNVRAEVLRREPLCRYCRSATPPVVRVAVAVDHSIAAQLLVLRGEPERIFDLSLLVPTCRPCHDARRPEEAETVRAAKAAAAREGGAAHA
jgi:hypothetical protein